MPGLEPSKEGVKQLFHMYRAAFSRSAHGGAGRPRERSKSGRARSSDRDATKASSWACPPPARGVDVQLIDITRFGDDGLAHEHWGVFDALAMMQQLGAIPQSPPDRSIGLATRRGRGTWMQPSRIHHVRFPVADLDASVAGRASLLARRRGRLRAIPVRALLAE